MDQRADTTGFIVFIVSLHSITELTGSAFPFFQPLVAASAPNHDEAERLYRNVAKIPDLKSKVYQMKCALYLLNRVFPTTTIGMCLSLIWQVCRWFAHTLYIGQIIEQALHYSPNFKKTSKLALELEMQIFQRHSGNQPSVIELLYQLLLMVNDSFIAKDNRVMCDAYSLLAFIFRWRFPTHQFITRWLTSRAIHLAASLDTVYDATVFHFYMMCKNMSEGNWVPAAKMGNILQQKFFDHQLLRVYSRCAVDGDFAMVGITFSVMHLAQGRVEDAKRDIEPSLVAWTVKRGTICQDAWVSQYQNNLAWLQFAHLSFLCDDLDGADKVLQLYQEFPLPGGDTPGNAISFAALRAFLRVTREDWTTALDDVMAFSCLCNSVDSAGRNTPMWTPGSLQFGLLSIIQYVEHLQSMPQSLFRDETLHRVQLALENCVAHYEVCLANSPPSHHPVYASYFPHFGAHSVVGTRCPLCALSGLHFVSDGRHGMLRDGSRNCYSLRNEVGRSPAQLLPG